MGFYGNTIYNTYGLQDKSVQPRHLDRNYWRWGRQVAVQSIKILRKNVLNLPAIGVDGFTADDWNDCWKEAEKSIFVFHFNKPSKSNGEEDCSTALRALFGAGLNIGWVIKESVNSQPVYCLYFLALGSRNRTALNRPGSIFRLELNPNGYTEDKNLSDYDNVGYKDSCESNWSNKYLVGPVLSDAHLLKNSVTEEKIKNDAVTTDKIKDEAVTTEKIDDDAITPEKLQREHLEKVELWSTISTWTDFCNQVDFIGTDNTEAAPGGSLYFVLEVNAPMPPLYSDLPNQKIERGLAWAASGDNHFILDCQNGRLWRIIKNSGNSGDDNVIPENGINYKIILQQIITEQIVDEAIIPKKLDRSYLEKIVIWNNGNNLTNWEDLFSQVDIITKNGMKNSAGGTLYFIYGINASILPNKYINASDADQLLMSRCLAWRSSINSILLYSFNSGQTWVIQRHEYSNKSLDSFSLTDEQIGEVINNNTIIYTIQLKQNTSSTISNQAIRSQHLNLYDENVVEGHASSYDVLLYNKNPLSGGKYIKADLQDSISKVYIEGDLYGEHMYDLFSQLFSASMQYIGNFSSILQIYQKMDIYNGSSNYLYRTGLVKYQRVPTEPEDFIGLPDGIYFCLKNADNSLIFHRLDQPGNYQITGFSKNDLKFQNLDTLSYITFWSYEEIKNLLNGGGDSTIVPSYFMVDDLYVGMERVNPDNQYHGPSVCLKGRKCSTGEIAYFYYSSEGGGRIVRLSGENVQKGCAFGCQSINTSSIKPNVAVCGQLFFATDEEILYVCTSPSGNGIAPTWTPIKGYGCSN